jgi:hypothetical protein
MRSTWKPGHEDVELVEMERDDLPDEVFAFPSQRRAPLTDDDQVRSALARFEEVQDVTDRDRTLAFANIMAAARHFDVEVAAADWRELVSH